MIQCCKYHLTYALSLQQEKKSYVSDKVNLNLNIRNISERRLRKCQNCYYLRHIYAQKKKKGGWLQSGVHRISFWLAPAHLNSSFTDSSILQSSLQTSGSRPAGHCIVQSIIQSPNTYKHNTMNSVSQHRIPINSYLITKIDQQSVSATGIFGEKGQRSLILTALTTLRGRRQE